MRRVNRDPYLTPKQLAAELDISERTAYRFCQSGRVPSYRVGGRWRIESRTNYLDLFSRLD